MKECMDFSKTCELKIVGTKSKQVQNFKNATPKSKDTLEQGKRSFKKTVNQKLKKNCRSKTANKKLLCKKNLCTKTVMEIQKYKYLESILTDDGKHNIMI